MDESYSSLLSAGVEKKLRELELSIMEDIMRRVKKAQSITDTADWQINRFIILGNSTQTVQDLIRLAVEGSEEEVRSLYEEIIDREYTRDKSLYEQIGRGFVPYEQNLELQQLVEALVQQSNEELYNITRSTGFMIDGGGGKLVFTPTADVYNHYLDNALTGLASGAYDYNTLVRRMVGQMTRSGLRTGHPFSDGGSTYGVDYASGWHNRVDVAARRALLTGFSQITGQITQTNAQRLGVNTFEVSWHRGARPEHQVWQGKVYTMEQLVSICGLGTGPGLEGWNCGHSYYPFIPGISERLYPDDWLEEQNRLENIPKEFRGKEYTVYEARQKQRQMETAMRAQRERVHLLRVAEADKDDITIAQCKYQAQMDEYRSFAKAMSLPTQMERVYTGRTTGRIAPSKQAYAKWKAAHEANKAKNSHNVTDPFLDVTAEYAKNATPGNGYITYDEGYKAGKHQEEIRVAQWMHNTYGGNIRLLNESVDFGVKKPDYEWRGKLWELKTVTTEKSADDALRRALRQIQNNPGGTILDYGNNQIDLNELQKIIERRIARGNLSHFDIIIKATDRALKVLRHKK